MKYPNPYYTSISTALENLYEGIKDVLTYENFLGTYTREDSVQFPAISYKPINPQWKTQGIECVISLGGVVEVSKRMGNYTTLRHDVAISLINHLSFTSLSFYTPVLTTPPKALMDYLRNNWGTIKYGNYSPLKAFTRESFSLEQLDIILEVITY